MHVSLGDGGWERPTSEYDGARQEQGGEELECPLEVGQQDVYGDDGDEGQTKGEEDQGPKLPGHCWDLGFRLICRAWAGQSGVGAVGLIPREPLQRLLGGFSRP